MRQLTLTLATLAASVALLAQTATTPNLSGTWVIKTSAPPRGTMVAEWTITQTTGALVITHALAGGAVQKFIYKLDGSERVNINGRTTLTTKSRWEAGALVTTGTQSQATDAAAIKSTFKETRRLDKDGTMAVETVRQLGTAAPSTTRQTFVRKT